MTESQQALIAFGPVPSRRLGRSLGINNIPPKSCSYSCIYCQVGATPRQEIEPRTFFNPDVIVQAVTAQVEAARANNEPVDYLTFVPDGEPTLDANLGTTIDLLRPLDIRIAVISNASLLWKDSVSRILNKADWVSLKIDTVDENTWHTINQPHPELKLPTVLQSIQHFADSYQGTLCTETMLVAGINDSPQSLEGVAEFLSTIQPHTAYLAAPIRPPTQNNVHIASESVFVSAYETLRAKVKNVQYLIGYEGDTFTATGDPKRDLLAITAVHPMREESVKQFLATADLDWSFVDNLIRKNELIEVSFAGRRFYIRKMPAMK